MKPKRILFVWPLHLLFWFFSLEKQRKGTGKKIFPFVLKGQRV